MNCIKIFQLILLLWIVMPVLASEEVFFKHYTSNNGLVHNTVTAITQDDEGFMWFGTEKGLSKFDGRVFTNYNPDLLDPNSIPSDNIDQLVTDKDGNIWLRSNNVVAQFVEDYQVFESYGREFSGRNLVENTIRSINSTNDGKLWLCTNKGLLEYDYDQKKFNKTKYFKSTSNNKSIVNIYRSNEGAYWIIQEDGVYHYESLEGAEPVFVFDFKDVESIGVNSIVEASDGKIYLATIWRGLYVIDCKSHKIENCNANGSLQVNSNLIRALTCDHEGNLWIGSELGINILRSRSNTMDSYMQDYNTSYSLNDNAIYSMYTDRQGNIWVGTFFGGINVCLKNSKGFKYIKAGYDQYSVSGKAISEIIEDDNKNLWIGTEDGGVTYYNKELGEMLHYTNINSGLSYVNIHALEIDDDKLWVGSFTGGLNLMQNDKFTHYNHEWNNPNSLPSNLIYSLCKSSKDSLYVGTTRGLCVYQPHTNNFKKVSGVLGDESIFEIEEDYNGNIWIGTFFNDLYVRFSEEHCFKRVNELINDTSVLISSRVIDIFPASDGTIKVGTFNDGFFSIDIKTWEVEHFNKQNGLSDNTIYSIVEDDYGNFWLSTNYGLIKQSSLTGDFTKYNIEDGLPIRQFNYKAGYKHSDGTIYMGTVNGLVSFKPEDIRFNNDVPEIKLVSFSVNNEIITPNGDQGLISRPIYNTKKIELKHYQSDLTFEFVATDYTIPENNKFKFVLEGFDRQWSNVSSENKAVFTNVPPGDYIFRVKGCNNDDVWNEDGVSIQIKIRPSFWQSNLGYTLYGLIILFILYIYRRLIKVRQREKNMLKHERVEKEKIKELNQLKLNFFTNISHEFRTPLSLIIDPLEKIKDGKLETSVNKSFINCNYSRSPIFSKSSFIEGNVNKITAVC